MNTGLEGKEFLRRELLMGAGQDTDGHKYQSSAEGGKRGKHE